MDFDFGSIIKQLMDEAKGLFGSKRRFNVPQGAGATGPSQEPINSPGGYTAPIHGDWHSSGGFTYSPNPTHPKGHMGVDMRAPAGTPVHPLSSGVVSNVGTDPMGGNVVNIQHANGVRTYYAHLSTVTAHKGDKVTPDTVIGTVGNTGNASHTFPHLHFQVWSDNQIQDPSKYFSVPAYTNLTPAEQQQGPWLSPQAREQAQAFNMRDHIEQHRVAFSRDVDKLLKLTFEYYRITK